MKIAYFSGAHVPSRGANSMHVMNMCQALAGLGHEVTLYVRPGDLHAADDHSFYNVAPSFHIVKHERPSIRVYGAIAHARLVRQTFVQRPLVDLIYAREYYCLAACANHGVPFVFESHWRPRHLGQRVLEGWFFRHPGFRRLVVISDALRREYLDLFPTLDAGHVLVAHDAANLASEDVLHAPSLERSGRPLAVGYVGSFFAGYGVQVLPRLARAMPHVQFHVVGGSDSDVAAACQQHGMPENLTYHGFVAPAKLAKLYGELDVVLAPYQPETPHIRWISPMKLFEYMSHGKAIVCSDFPVMREVLTDRRDALLVNPTSLQEWQRAIEQLADVELRKSLGAAARAKLAAEYTWDARAAAVLAGLSVSVR